MSAVPLQVLTLGLAVVVASLLASAASAGAGAAAVAPPAAAAPAAVSAAAADPNDDAQDFVLFGASRPVLLRLHLRVVGKPFRALFKEFADEVFTGLDKNRDGVLSKDELDKLPPVGMILDAQNSYLGSFRPLRLEEVDADRDGKVTRQELAAFFENNGATLFNFVQPSDAGERMNETLFKHLDTDRDGKLSKEELRAAPALLLALDKDDDEMVAAAELDGTAANPYAAEVARRRGERVPRGPRVRPAVFMIKPGDSARKLAGELFSFYARTSDPKAEQKLSAAEIGLDEPAFRALDTNRDGTLDMRELSRFANRTPDLELTVHIDDPKLKDAPISVAPRVSPLAGQYRLEEKRELVAELGTTRFHLSTISAPRPQPTAAMYRQNYVIQFKNADKDNNGFLDRNEAQSTLFGPFFDLLDADGDGKLYEKEIDAFLSRLGDLQQRSMNSRTSLSVSAEGQGLFDILDGNKDSRLSVREIRGLVTLLDKLDGNRNGFLERSEIPRKYRLRVQRGPGDAGMGGNRVAALTRGMMAAPAAVVADGPTWFRQMDRNRDGDVSRREFLGSDEQFRKLDTDGDGLISLEEAKRAEAQHAADKQKAKP